MNSKFSQYVVERLAANGFAVIDHELARELTHDLIWVTARDALGDFTAAQRKLDQFLGDLPRIVLLEVQFADDPAWRLVVTRSADRLAERIGWITGREVASLRAYAPVQRVSDGQNAQTTASDDGPPSHQCEIRREWFASRGLKDPQLAGTVRR